MIYFYFTGGSVSFNEFQSQNIIVDNLLITYILGAADIPKNFYEIHARAGRVIELLGHSENFREVPALFVYIIYDLR